MRVRQKGYVHWVLLFGLLICLPRASNAQQSTIRGENFEIQFGGLVQTQLNTTTVDTVADEADLFLRRVRLEAGIRFGDLVSGVIVPEFAAGGDAVELEEAFILLEFSPALQFLAGKADRPFGIVDALEASNILPVERAARIRGAETLDLYNIHELVAYAGNSVGVQVLGEPQIGSIGLSYAFGYFTGALGEEGAEPGRDIQQFAGRVSIQPAEKINLGAALTFRTFFQGADTLGNAPASAPTERGSAYVLDAIYGSFEEPQPGFKALFEYSAGVLDPFTETDFSGFQSWLGYRTGPFGYPFQGIEPLIRVSRGDVDGELSDFGGVLVTPGVNLYLGQGNHRLMLNYDFWNPEEGDSEGSFKAQLQLAF